MREAAAKKKKKNSRWTQEVPVGEEEEGEEQVRQFRSSWAAARTAGEEGKPLWSWAAAEGAAGSRW